MNKMKETSQHLEAYKNQTVKREIGPFVLKACAELRIPLKGKSPQEYFFGTIEGELHPIHDLGKDVGSIFTYRERNIGITSERGGLTFVNLGLLLPIIDFNGQNPIGDLSRPLFSASYRSGSAEAGMETASEIERLQFGIREGSLEHNQVDNFLGPQDKYLRLDALLLQRKDPASIVEPLLQNWQRPEKSGL